DELTLLSPTSITATTSPFTASLEFLVLDLTFILLIPLRLRRSSWLLRFVQEAVLTCRQTNQFLLQFRISLRVPPVEAQASATSPKEEESEWKGYTLAGLPPRYPGIAISQPPEGYSDALASAPALEALEGMGKCLNPVVGLEESDMQYHSA
ncbi:hypothetical protein V8G54_006418, partial [Vigna mungo]